MSAFFLTSFILVCNVTGLGKPDKEPFRTGEQEPWVHRGGLHAEFRVSAFNYMTDILTVLPTK